MSTLLQPAASDGKLGGGVERWTVPRDDQPDDTAKLEPSLAAGCSSVLKPAEETPLSALIFEKILTEAGVPDGVVNLVNGYGHTTGQALIEHADVDKIAFTGSTEVGKLIVQATAGNLKRVMLELGGESPVLIYDDADLDKAIPAAAMGIFIHSGQACSPTPRFRERGGVYERVVEGIASLAGEAARTRGKSTAGRSSARGGLAPGSWLHQQASATHEVVIGGHRLDRLFGPGPGQAGSACASVGRRSSGCRRDAV